MPRHQSKPKSTMSLAADDVIVEHPHTGRPGEWTVTALYDRCRVHSDVEITDADGVTTPLILPSDAKVQVRASVEEIQHDCAMALMAITRKGLPPLQWSIGFGEAQLTGSFYRSDDTTRDPDTVVSAWAEWLENAEQAFIPNHNDTEYGYVRMIGQFEGVSITVIVYDIHRPAEEKAEVPA